MFNGEIIGRTWFPIAAWKIKQPKYYGIRVFAPIFVRPPLR